MKNAPNLPVHCEKFLSKTYKLSLEELGALFRLMMVTWNNKGQAIPDDPDEMARSLTCTKDRWLKKLRPRLLPMFDLSEGTWKLAGPMSPMNMEEQWDWVQNNMRVKAENGAKGGRPPAQKVAGVLGNPYATPAQQFDETQTAKSLENIETAKPVGFEPVKRDESTANVIVTEVSKKESPHSPPNGGMANGVLFPVQEVQHAPVREAKQTRRKKHQSLKDAPKASPEIEEAFLEFKSVYPRRNHPHSWGEAKELFVEAMESGVSGDLLIQTAEKFAKIVRADGDEGTRVVADARTWLFQRRWERYADFQPVPPKTNGSNVTPLRNGTNHSPEPVIRRGGLTY